MPNDERMTKPEGRRAPGAFSSFGLRHSFVIGHSSFRPLASESRMCSMPGQSPLPTQDHPWRWPALASLLIVTAAALRLFSLAADCPLDLSPDEAHYWDWSRH